MVDSSALTVAPALVRATDDRRVSVSRPEWHGEGDEGRQRQEAGKMEAGKETNRKMKAGNGNKQNK